MEKGSIYIRTIKDKQYYYRSFRENGKTISKYLGPVGSEKSEPYRLEYEQKKRILTYAKAVSGISTSWEDCKKKKYHFPVIAKTDAFEISRVHPLHQAGALKLHECICADARVEKIILFGSSTTVRCNARSDYDLVVFLKEDSCDLTSKNDVSELLQISVEWNADILWADRLDPESEFYQNAMRGVQIA